MKNEKAEYSKLSIGNSRGSLVSSSLASLVSLAVLVNLISFAKVDLIIVQIQYLFLYIK
jgi:hypothetical protein